MYCSSRIKLSSLRRDLIELINESIIRSVRVVHYVSAIHTAARAHYNIKMQRDIPPCDDVGALAGEKG